MFKNVAGQKFRVFAFDSATNLPKSGDAANITAYISKDFGVVTVLGDTSATEEDATNAKGYYLFDATQAETNADQINVSGKSGSTGIVVVGGPAAIFTLPPLFTTLVIDANGLANATAVKLGPSGAGTALTARDIGLNVLLSPGTGTGQLDFTSGVVKSNLVQMLGTVLTETAGQLAGGFKQFFNIAVPAATMDHGVLVDTVTNLTTKTGFALTAAYDPAKTAAQAGDAMSLTAGERNSTADAFLDRASGVEAGCTPRQLFRLWLAGLCGPRTLFGTNAPNVQNPAGTKNRLIGSGIDANGNGTWATDTT